MPWDTHRTRFNQPVLPVLMLFPIWGGSVISSCASTFHSPSQPEVADSSTLPPPRSDQAPGPLADPGSENESQPSPPRAAAVPRVDAEQDLHTEIETAQAEKRVLLDEIKALYRRLHIELDTPGRSSLIVELFRDPRADLKMLGFELADRDLSASKVLGEGVDLAVREMLHDSNPQIRAKSARLITRIAPPDGMIIITQSLVQEQSPIAADPMLMGVARWPNNDAVRSVRAWLIREDAPLTALFSAAWALEQESLWDAQSDEPVLLAKLRGANPTQLREDGMKLLAKLGTSEDLQELVRLMLSEDASVVRWSASALVETARAVEVLTQSAVENEVLYQPAAEAIIKHRPTPEGMRRLAELPQSDPLLRRQTLERMGQALGRDQLGEGVRLSRLEPEIAILVLSRLLTNDQAHTPRTAKGVLLLGELQLDAGRPNRVAEAMIAIGGTQLDPADLLRRDSLRVQSLLLLGRIEEAATISLDFSTWNKAIERSVDPQQKSKLAAELLSRASSLLTPEQLAHLGSLVQTPVLKPTSLPTLPPTMPVDE